MFMMSPAEILRDSDCKKLEDYWATSEVAIFDLPLQALDFLPQLTEAGEN